MGNKTTIPRQTWIVKVPFERPTPYEEHPTTLAEEIRKKRMQSGLTQRELGELLKVDECTIYNWERGIGPKPGLRRRVNVFLKV